MKLPIKCVAAIAAAVAFAVGARSASAATIVTVVGTNGPGVQANATAVFTFNVGNLTIDLTNNVDDPGDAGSLLGGVIFTVVNGGSGSVSGFNASAPNGLINIDGSGNPTAVAPTAMSAWGLVGTDPYTLKVAGNDPLIIGNADNAGKYTGNPSLTNGSHDPFALKTAHFTMNIAGMTTASDVSNVSFFFGTDFNALASTGTSHEGGSPPSTPLPAAAWGGLALMGSLGAGSLVRRKRQQA